MKRIDKMKESLRPRLVEDWRDVLKTAGSFWFQVTGIIALIAPEIRYQLTGIDSDPYFLWWLGLLLLICGLIWRLVQQNGPSFWIHVRMWTVALLVLLLAWLAATEVGAAPASEQQTLDIAVPFIAAKEGKRNTAYIPVPGDVPTICYGSTHDIRLGMTMTDRQCLALLQAEVAAYRLALHRYYLAHTIETLLPPARDAAFTSLGYNIGVDACGRSTAVRRLNSGDVSGACDAITWWNRFGKRVMRGLVDRRADERQLCMMGA